MNDGGAEFPRFHGLGMMGLGTLADSLAVIKKLVFEEKFISFAEFKQVIDSDFKTAPALLARVKNGIPLFGSGSDEAIEMANLIAGRIQKCYSYHRNYRGGKYLTGFWSVAWHSGFGLLTGTLPSGRLKEMPFTPGLTPQPHASENILDNLRDVAKLNPKFMDNNIAFNVKFVPNAKDSREKMVDTIFSYVKTYCQLGGMQLQFNMVDSETLKDAMAHPENYKNLIVRISGYNARFVDLSKHLQIELIHRSQFNA